jgi:type IV fimbrial biogenesis protein FimT
MRQSTTGYPMRIPKSPYKSKGVTLLELMVVLAIVGVLASFALPNLRQFLVTQEVRSTSFDLLAALTYARSEAIKRNGSVQVAAVDASDWGKGWQVSVVSGGAVLRSQAASARAAISVNPSGTGTVVFSRTGRPTGSVKLQIGAKGSSTDVTPRCLSMSITGQPSSAVGACA